MMAVKRITGNPSLWKLGLVQSLFEGSMCAPLAPAALAVPLHAGTCS